MCNRDRESVAMGEILTCHVPSTDNPADICTKVIPAGHKRDQLIGLILYDLTDDHAERDHNEQIPVTRECV